MRLKSKLLFVNVPSTKPDSVVGFYNDVLGVDLARSLTEDVTSYHAPIDEDGIDINVTDRQYEGEQITCYFGVDDLDAALGDVKQSGGKVVAGPFDVQVDDKIFEEYKKQQLEDLRGPDREEVEQSLGRSAVVVDPGGVPFGLMELKGHAQRHYNAGRHQRELRAPQIRAQKRAKELGKKIKKK
jgi:predicted enzyme related to lactoylglutathione lyase